jgi:hypothetical protein
MIGEDIVAGISARGNDAASVEGASREDDAS